MTVSTKISGPRPWLGLVPTCLVAVIPAYAGDWRLAMAVLATGGAIVGVVYWRSAKARHRHGAKPPQD